MSQVFWNSCCSSLWCLGRYQGFTSCAKTLLQPGQGRGGTLWDQEEPNHGQSCHREQDLPGPAVLAQAGAVLVGGIHHRGSSGCKSSLGSVK